jgi:glucosamine--fructose-6-phosphate aminotransferase (isomerizing)
VSHPAGGVLHAEIHAQPEVLERFRTREAQRVRDLGGRLASTRPRGIYVAARGSSDHAAVYAKYLFGERVGLPVALAAPSLVTRYGRLPQLEDWLVLGLSQSGESPDIVAVLEAARSRGARTIAITDRPDSPLGRAAEEIVDLHVGGERSVAATGTFTATLYALAHLAAAWTDTDADLDDVPERLRQTLGGESAVKRIAEDLDSTQACVVLGRGFSFAVALEWALKLKEVAGIWAEPYSAADYRHGPIALAAPGLAAFLIDPQGPGRTDVRNLEQELSDRGVRVVRVSDAAEADLRFPEGPEWLSVIPSAALGQLLALHLARVRGLDPDRPTGLTKVTRTL